MTVHEEELLRRIRELEKLNGYLHQQIKEHRYGLTWIDVPEAFEKASENKIPILEEVKDKSFTDDSKKPTHILIEGDNYHALTCLQYTHKEKIDVIYIDPPYNTGSDGFTYKDKRILTEYPDGTPVPKEHPLRHSYWLSFMHKRLELAKNLLSDDGVIFISIDDNEQANLKLLCDKVFGENGFVTVLHVEMSATQGMKVKAAKDGTIVKNTEYILVYSKDGHNNVAKNILYDHRPDYDEHYSFYLTEDNTLIKVKEIYKKQFPDANIRNLSQMYEENSTFRQFVRDNQDKIFADDKITGFDISMFKEIGKIYRVSKNNRSYYIFNNGKKLRQLLCLKDSFGYSDDFSHKYGLRKIRGDWWKEFYKDMGNVSKEGDVVYQNGKKPVRLIQQLIKMSSKTNSVVLDFFAGSGTTLHAVAKQNNEDKGTRMCIMVQQSERENNICETKTYVRCENVLLKKDKLGGSLKYYRAAFTGTGNSHRDPIMLPSDEDRISLAKNAGVLVSLAENTLYEIVKNDYYQIFTNNHGRFSAVYLQEDFKQFEDFRQEIEKLGGNVTVYVFSWGNNPDAANAFMHLPNVDVKSYPNAILDAYKSALQQIESQK